MRLKMIYVLVGVALLACTPVVQADTTTNATDSVSQPPVRQVGRSLVYTISIEGAIGAVTAERIAEASASRSSTVRCRFVCILRR